MSLVFSCLVPHPPIIVPEVGGLESKKVLNTVHALQQLEKDLYASKPEILIVISPHGTILPEAFSINLADSYYGDLAQFNAPEVTMSFKGESGLAYRIKEANETSLPINLITETFLDHGIVVPLYFLAQNLKNVTLIPIGYCLKDLNLHYQFGQALKEQIQKSNKRVAVIASGDLSHCLTADAPGGYSPRGKEFDKKLVQLIKENKVQEILKLDPDLIQEAGECGLRSLVILLGVLDNVQFQPEILSYEGPFGVGYLVTDFKLS